LDWRRSCWATSRRRRLAHLKPAQFQAFAARVCLPGSNQPWRRSGPGVAVRRGACGGVRRWDRWSRGAGGRRRVS
jgi:hypothetical protein